jgi:hypothetical protein
MDYRYRQKCFVKNLPRFSIVKIRYFTMRVKAISETIVLEMIRLRCLRRGVRDRKISATYLITKDLAQKFRRSRHHLTVPGYWWPQSLRHRALYQSVPRQIHNLRAANTEFFHSFSCKNPARFVTTIKRREIGFSYGPAAPFFTLPIDRRKYLTVNGLTVPLGHSKQLPHDNWRSLGNTDAPTRAVRTGSQS